MRMPRLSLTTRIFLSSAGIVVLIMALLGAAMWVTFKDVWKSVETDTKDKVAEIGDP